MPLTAGGLIRTARDGHPSFTREAHPDAVLVRALSAEQRRIIPKLVAENPSAVAATLEPIVPAAFDFVAGRVLPQHHFVHDPAEAVGAYGATQPVYKISWGNRSTARPRYAFYVHGGRLYLAGTLAEWSSVTAVNVSYAPVAPDLATMDAVLAVSDAAESYLTRWLEAFMAGRRPMDTLDVALKIGERNTAEADLLREVSAGFRATYARPVRRR